MTPHDRESATALVARVERDGEWHVAAWTTIVDSDSERIAGVTGHLTSAAQDEQNAADIVEARRLLPVMQREIERLQEMALRTATRLVDIDVHIERRDAETAALRARLEAVDPDEREPAEEPLASLSSRDEKCECCGGVIHAGTDLAAFVEADGRQVFAHWGPCPEPDLWAAQCADHDGEWYPIYRADALPAEVPVIGPYEETWPHAKGAAMSCGDMLGGVRLLRLRSRCTALDKRPVPDGVECTYRQEPCGRPAVSGERCKRHGGRDA